MYPAGYLLDCKAHPESLGVDSGLISSMRGKIRKRTGNSIENVGSKDLCVSASVTYTKETLVPAGPSFQTRGGQTSESHSYSREPSLSFAVVHCCYCYC